LYTYNLASDSDELYDLASLATILQNDTRWLAYRHSFRIDRYFELPRFEDADPQLQSGPPR
jgi:hypothetical protein